MKTATSISPSDSRVAGTARQTNRDHDLSSYGTAAETRELVANSLAARNERLAADDMVSTEEAAELANTSRVTINAWIEKGRCIGLAQTKRGYRLPRWQFEPRMWALIPKLSTALATKDGWALLAFLEVPQGALGGISPRVAIERGMAERVLAIAEQEGN